ncbi:MAG: hypothetical protein WC783_00675 [Candidatus Paceibacterota bacterium]|jgi:hypothetical protein
MDNSLRICRHNITAEALSVYWHAKLNPNSVDYFNLYISEDAINFFIFKKVYDNPGEDKRTIRVYYNRNDEGLQVKTYYLIITTVDNYGVESNPADSPIFTASLNAYGNDEEATVGYVDAQDAILQSQITTNLSTLNAHITNFSNPHHVTAGQIGAEPSWFEFTAGQNLAAGSIVRISAANTVVRADHSSINTCRSTIGITIEAKNAGETIKVYENDEYDFGAPVLVAGSIYYLSDNGTITNDPSTFAAPDVVLQIGIAKTTSIIIMDLKEPLGL